MLDLDPGELPRRDLNALLNGVVVPRPIAWVSTLAADGTPNLAPFSFFNLFSYDPPTIVIGCGHRRGIAKDTVANVRANGELVVSMVGRGLAERANATSAECEPHVDEWEAVGINPAPSVTVAPPRVAEAPASLECRVRQLVELGEGERIGNVLVIARVTRIHIVEAGLLDGRVDAETLDLVGRMGGEEWSTTRDRFSLPRPAAADPAEVRKGRAAPP